jgi:uncharacterized membrane protein
MKKKLITTILVVFIFILLLVAVFIKDLIPLEIFEKNMLLIYGGIGAGVIILVGIIIFVNKSKGVAKTKPIKKVNSQKTNGPENEVPNNINKNELKKKSDILIQELKEAETQFLKNKISKETFDKISKEKNADLIRIEAQLDTNKKVNMGIEEIKAIDSMSANKKNVLKGLLEEKQRKIYELQLTEKGFMKRKLDESTYKKISEEVKSEIISIEGKIKALQKSEAIDKIKKELIEGAKEIKKQQKSTKKRVAAQPKTFEDEVFEQIGFR